MIFIVSLAVFSVLLLAYCLMDISKMEDKMMQDLEDDDND